MGLGHGSFEWIDLIGCLISLMEGILGNLRSWFSILYSPMFEEVYERIAFPCDSLIEGISLEEVGEIVRYPQ